LDTEKESIEIAPEFAADEYTVVAVDGDGYQSFMAEPVLVLNNDCFNTEAEDCSIESSIEIIPATDMCELPYSIIMKFPFTRD